MKKSLIKFSVLLSFAVFTAMELTINFVTASETKRWATPENLKPGLYTNLGTMYNYTWRQVVSKGSRFCIQIADGPASPYHGARGAVISSLSISNGHFIIDSYGTKIEIAQNEVEEKDGFIFMKDDEHNPWPWRSANDYIRPELSECLNANGVYFKKVCDWIESKIEDISPQRQSELMRKCQEDKSLEPSTF